MSPSVLFVDDEPHILSALRRTLRGPCRGWELRFANGGEHALELLAQEPADVVVSDMRMPGMSGAELLGHVRRLYPSTARLVLSGHSDQAEITRAVGPTQQFLSKPCDVDTLLGAIRRVIAVRDLLEDERLRGILGAVEWLPKPPAVHEQILDVASRPDSCLSDVVAVFEGDLALCAEIIKLVNSAFFGLPSQVDTVERAVALLGIDCIHALAVSGQVFAAGGPAPAGLDLAALRRRGLHAGAMARAIGTGEGWPRRMLSQAFLAGVLRDLGLLVLATTNGEGWQRLALLPQDDPWALRAAELEVFGCTVPEATAYLLGLWGFSEPVVQAIALQPVHAQDDPVDPLARALDFACRRSTSAGGHPLAAPWLDADRVERWNASCDAVPAG